MISKDGLQLNLIAAAIYGPCIWFIKLSLFIFLLELFGSLLWLRRMTIAGIVITGLYYWAAMIAFVTMCSPSPTGPHSQSSYLEGLRSDKCNKTRPMQVVTAAVNMISDLYLILLSLPPVWSLKLPLCKKLGVSMIFLTGFMSGLFILSFRLQSLTVL